MIAVLSDKTNIVTVQEVVNNLYKECERLKDSIAVKSHLYDKTQSYLQALCTTYNLSVTEV